MCYVKLIRESPVISIFALVNLLHDAMRICFLLLFGDAKSVFACVFHLDPKNDNCGAVPTAIG